MSDRDRARAERIRNPEERRYFLAAQASLRHILAQSLGIPQRRLAVVADERGKPRLAGDPLRFNTSRCGATVLIGTSEIADIGVDIEHLRELPDAEGLAQHHLSPGEFESWRSSAAASRDTGFLDLWTRKEACVKATGLGLTMPLELVDVRQAAQGPVHVAVHAGRREWELNVVSLRMPLGLVAAAALCVVR